MYDIFADCKKVNAVRRVTRVTDCINNDLDLCEDAIRRHGQRALYLLLVLDNVHFWLVSRRKKKIHGASHLGYLLITE